MRQRFSFSSRHTRNIENIRKQKKSFPDVVIKLIQESEIILEILDIRFIEETRNRDLEKEIKKQKKKIIFVLNKADLVDKDSLDKNKLKKVRPYVLISSKNRSGGKDLREKIKIESVKINKSDPFNRVKVGVVGYPNTGKSTLINFLTGRTSARSSPQSGFTKGLQKIRLSRDILLIDSPGVIPNEKYSSDNSDLISQHAKIGARSYDSVKDPELAVFELMKKHTKNLEDYYKVESNGDSELLIELIGNKRNMFISKGKVDEDKVARMILKDWQTGKIKV